MSTITTTSGLSGVTDISKLEQSAFKKADQDGDGAITQTELQTLLENKPRLARTLLSLVDKGDGSTPSASDLMEALDADSDGKVTESEFSTALNTARASGRQEPPPPPPSSGAERDAGFSEMLQQIFAKGDSDADGALTETDLETMMQQIPGLARDLGTLAGSTDTSATSKGVFTQLDQDGDGKISSSEFVDAVTQAHQKIVAQEGDANSISTTGNSQSASTLLLELLHKLQAQSGYGPNGVLGSSSEVAATTFNATA